MPKALANRLMHYNVICDFSSWKVWALQNHIDSRILGYLSFDNSRLFAAPESSDLAYPTPRSWTFVNSILKVLGELPLESSSAHQLISACVGKDVSIEFRTWCEVYNYLPTVADICSGRCREYPKTQDALYALSASLADAVCTASSSVSLTELDNICAYASHFPSDFALAFFKDINQSEEMKLKLMKCRSLQSWLSRNKHFL